MNQQPEITTTSFLKVDNVTDISQIDTTVNSQSTIEAINDNVKVRDDQEDEEEREMRFDASPFIPMSSAPIASTNFQ